MSVKIKTCCALNSTNSVSLQTAKCAANQGHGEFLLVFAGDVLEVAVKLLCPAGVSRGAVVDLLREAKSAVS